MGKCFLIGLVKFVARAGWGRVVYANDMSEKPAEMPQIILSEKVGKCTLYCSNTRRDGGGILRHMSGWIQPRCSRRLFESNQLTGKGASLDRLADRGCVCDPPSPSFFPGVAAPAGAASGAIAPPAAGAASPRAASSPVDPAASSPLAAGTGREELCWTGSCAAGAVSTDEGGAAEGGAAMLAPLLVLLLLWLSPAVLGGRSSVLLTGGGMAVGAGSDASIAARVLGSG